MSKEPLKKKDEVVIEENFMRKIQNQANQVWAKNKKEAFVEVGQIQK
jgi:hypothetical protein